MKRILHRERGIAAMEMTVVAGFSIIMLAMIVLAGRFTWHAIALTKSVANANRIVATLPRTTLAADPAILLSFTKNAITDATMSAGLDLQPRGNGFGVMCGVHTCSSDYAGQLSVGAVIDFRDTIFDSAYQDIGLLNVAIRAGSIQTSIQPYPDVPPNLQ